MFGSVPCSAQLPCRGPIQKSHPVSQQRGRVQGIRSLPSNLADVPHQLIETFRHWHNSLEEQASDHDYARFWAARAVNAAKTDEETSMAQELYSLDIVFQRSEELVQVLGVQPAVLIEILTREPGLLVVTPSQLGVRVMALKMSLPLLNVPELIRRHPRVLRSENGVSAVKRAVKDMDMLMPAYHVQERLLDDDGQMWMSFKERLMYWERQIQLTSQTS